MDNILKLCMFCGKDETFGKMNREHFVPRGMWDRERPQLTRTVWAHESCNRAFSSDNEYFRDVMAMEFGADRHPEVRRLYSGTLKRKFKKRRGSILKTTKGLKLRPVHTCGGIYLGHAPSFRVDWPRLERVLKNVMKGIFYTVQKRPMPAHFSFEITVATDENLEPVRDLIGTMTKWSDFGDDVFRCRYVFDTDPEKALICLMQFYRNRVFFGVALSPDLQEIRQEFNAPQTNLNQTR